MKVKSAMANHLGGPHGNSMELKNMENLIPDKSSSVQFNVFHFGKELVQACPHGEFILFCNSFPWQQFRSVQTACIDVTDSASSVKRERERDPYRDLSEIAMVHWFLKNYLIFTSLAISLPQEIFLFFVSQKVQNRPADH